MERKTKQIITIVICLLITGFGAYYNISTYLNVDHQNLFKIFGF